MILGFYFFIIVVSTLFYKNLSISLYEDINKIDLLSKKEKIFTISIFFFSLIFIFLLSKNIFIYTIFFVSLYFLALIDYIEKEITLFYIFLFSFFSFLIGDINIYFITLGLSYFIYKIFQSFNLLLISNGDLFIIASIFGFLGVDVGVLSMFILLGFFVFVYLFEVKYKKNKDSFIPIIPFLYISSLFSLIIIELNKVYFSPKIIPLDY